MAPSTMSRGTRQALLRLRRLEELDARRGLETARGELERSRAASARTRVALVEAERRLARAADGGLARAADGGLARAAERGTSPGVRAGELAARDQERRAARAECSRTRAQLREADRAVDGAERATEVARVRTEIALRAREATVAYETAEAIGAARRADRLEEIAADDRQAATAALTTAKKRR